MKKSLMIVTAMLVLGQFASANPTSQMLNGMIEHMRQTIASECADEAALSCMDVPTKQCIKIKEGVLDSCTIPALSSLSEISEASIAKLQAQNLECTIAYVTEKHDIDLQQFVRCVGADSFDADALEAIDNN